MIFYDRWATVKVTTLLLKVVIYHWILQHRTKHCWPTAPPSFPGVHTLVNTLCTHLRFWIFFSPKERSALNMCTGDRPCNDICSKFSPRSKKGSTESQQRGWDGLWVRLRSMYTSWFILECMHLNTWNQKRLLIHLPHCHIVCLTHLASRVVWASQNRWDPFCFSMKWSPFR